MGVYGGVQEVFWVFRGYFGVLRVIFGYFRSAVGVYGGVQRYFECFLERFLCF